MGNFRFAVVFFSILLLIGVLSYGQGRWDGMKRLCPEPNILGLNRTKEVVCFTQEYWEELNKEPEDNFNLEEYNAFKT